MDRLDNGHHSTSQTNRRDPNRNHNRIKEKQRNKHHQPSRKQPPNPKKPKKPKSHQIQKPNQHILSHHNYPPLPWHIKYRPVILLAQQSPATGDTYCLSYRKAIHVHTCIHRIEKPDVTFKLNEKIIYARASGEDLQSTAYPNIDVRTRHNY
jgi:hypothetical protein